jgi:polygalacturonase
MQHPSPRKIAAMSRQLLRIAIVLALACLPVLAAPEIPKIPAPQIPDRSFNVTDFGAVADGKTLNTSAIAAAIDACKKAGGGRVIIPAGTFLTGPIDLANNLELHLKEGAVLLFSNNPDDYPIGGTPSLPERHTSLISIENGHDIAITGKGKIDGQGQPWWEPIKQSKKSKQPFTERRPKMMVFYRCQRVRIEGVHLTNAPMFHMSPTQSQDVVCDGVTVFAAPDSPNTDSFNPSGWNILLINCTFDIGDDNVAVKPFVKPGDGRLSVENLYITKCHFLHGHGLSVGGQTPGGLRNMWVWDCVFEDTDTGIRLKAERGDGGLVENVHYENLTMKNVGMPIQINSYYHGLPKPGEKHEVKPVDEKTPIWRNIHISNITATGAKQAGLLMGLPEMPIENVTLQNVKIDATEPMRIGYVKGLKFENVEIRTPSGVDPLRIEEQVEGEGLGK